MSVTYDISQHFVAQSFEQLRLGFATCVLALIDDPSDCTNRCKYYSHHDTTFKSRRTHAAAELHLLSALDLVVDEGAQTVWLCEAHIDTSHLELK